eukprot:scaffold17867_cov40-Phaeocystis_antarctica.AAC.1
MESTVSPGMSTGSPAASAFVGTTWEKSTPDGSNCARTSLSGLRRSHMLRVKCPSRQPSHASTGMGAAASSTAWAKVSSPVSIARCSGLPTSRHGCGASARALGWLARASARPRSVSAASTMCGSSARRAAEYGGRVSPRASASSASTLCMPWPCRTSVRCRRSASVVAAPGASTTKRMGLTARRFSPTSFQRSTYQSGSFLNQGCSASGGR